MRHLFFGLLCGLLPVAAHCNPVTKAALALAEYPELDVDAFVDHVAVTFGTVTNVETYGPDDVPEGHSDPYYWSGSFFASQDGAKIMGTCSRIGRESDALLRSEDYRWGVSQSSFSDLLDPTVILQGYWPWPLPAFMPDAAARLDCSLTFIGGILPETDPESTHAIWATAFADVRNLTSMSSLFGHTMTVTAVGGNGSSVRKLDRATMTTDANGFRVTITSWLLAGTS